MRCVLWSSTSYLCLFVCFCLCICVCVCVWGGGGELVVFIFYLCVYVWWLWWWWCSDVYVFSWQPRYTQNTPHSGPGSVKTAARPRRKQAAAARGPSEVEGGADSAELLMSSGNRTPDAGKKVRCRDAVSKMESEITIDWNTYILLTEREVRMGEYCSSSLFTCLWTEPLRRGP